MKRIFDELSFDCSRITTQAYSTSFSLGIRFLDRRLHRSIYAIYGFVRFADEIVDSFHNYNKAVLLHEFKQETWKAIKNGISINPILNSFQHTVTRYGIENELIERFFKSMEADLEQKNHSETSYEEYIYGSAEVVGLMCLRVFADNDDELFLSLRQPARSLGAAFQKVNFLRDMSSDYKMLGRIYFPGVNFASFSETEKEKIQRDIEADFEKALAGIKLLPVSSRKGVYLAYFYYKKLFLMIKSLPADKALSARIRIPNHRKIGLMFQSMIRHQLNLL